MNINKNKKNLVLLDVNAIAHRAYHAFPDTLRANGIQTNALYGFGVMLLEVIDKFHPDYFVACVDIGKAEKRLELYKEYKATRKPMDQELADQIPLIHEMVKAFDIPIYSKKGYEADDLIGTIVNLKNIEGRPDLETIIVTGDKDIFQLVDDDTFVYLSGTSFSKSKLYDADDVKRKMGFGPEYVIDYKALRGDPSDNIPGVPGIGEKSAQQLLSEYGHLDKIIQNIDNIDSTRIQNAMSKGVEEAKLSRQLATIDRKVDVEFNLDSTKFDGLDKDRVYDFFGEYNFRSLSKKLNKLNGEISQARSVDSQFGIFDTHDVSKPTDIFAGLDYVVLEEADINEVLDELEKQTFFAFDTETTSLDLISNDLVGISFSYRENSAYYLSSNWIKGGVKDRLVGIFGDESIKKIGHNIKFDIHALNNFDIEVKGVSFDTMIAAYLLRSGQGNIGLKALGREYFGVECLDYKELIKLAEKNGDLRTVPVDVLGKYACQDADLTWKLYEVFRDELSKSENQKLKSLFYELEMPTMLMLKTMERKGIRLDEEYLSGFAGELDTQIEKLKADIYEESGVEFNLNSPKQLGEVLFDKMGLSGAKKTKTGAYSTNERVLKDIVGESKIVGWVLEYRELSKLRSTYTDALIDKVNDKTGRVHSSFNQTVASTGRLSSSDPNLQNIPISSKMGKKIRQAFVPSKGKIFVSLDYSQQELRILASVSQDDELVRSYKEGVDVHALTASKLYGVEIDQVDKTQRSVGKTVNFSVIYGISAYGLADRLKISQDVAQEFIDRYFDTYPGVKSYFDKLLDTARVKGVIETKAGRRRDTSGLRSGNFRLRSASEREVINFPIQGGAADMMKQAMVNCQGVDVGEWEEYDLLVQVHDELLFEVPLEGIDSSLGDFGKLRSAFELDSKLQKFVDRVEEGMLEANKYDIDMKVDVGIGKNWGDLREVSR